MYCIYSIYSVRAACRPDREYLARRASCACRFCRACFTLKLTFHRGRSAWMASCASSCTRITYLYMYIHTDIYAYMHSSTRGGRAAATPWACAYICIHTHTYMHIYIEVPVAAVLLPLLGLVAGDAEVVLCQQRTGHDGHKGGLLVDTTSMYSK